jgi:sugar O-acyltransferase (sialic acid O-acetyltransferase NeuD family)
MRDLVIFGASAFAEVAHYYFANDSEHRVVAFSVDGAFVEEPHFHGLPVVPAEEIEKSHPPDRFGMFVAMGYHELNQQRARKVAWAEARGYRLASFLSSKADVGRDLVLEPNTMVMERCVLQPFVKVGRDCILWSTTRVGFHTRFEDHCWVVCALFGESVTVGEGTFVGLNATLAPGISIGKGNVIGAGALVMKSTRDFEVYKGTASTAADVPSTRLRF